MQALVAKEGVKVISAKDAYVRALEKMDIPNLPKSIHELEQRLLKYADEYYETFKDEKAVELQLSRHTISIEAVYSQVRADIHKILKEDIESYGAMNAVKLNYLLSHSHDLPICNIFYGRDQSNTLGNEILISEMRWDIRKPETEIYKTALKELGFEDHIVNIEEGTIEGGDSIILGGTCYIGVGARTTLSAAKEVYRKVGANLEKKGIQVVAVINERHERESASPSKPTTEHMQAMHLDMFWIPLASGLVLAGKEIDNRNVLRLSEQDGNIVSKEAGTFRDFMNEKKIELIEVTEQEQKDYAVNLLNFGNNKVLVALSKNERVIREMESRGFKVIHADLNKLVGGYGAAHCLTAPIVRG